MKIEERISAEYPDLLSPQDYAKKLEDNNQLTAGAVENYILLYSQLVSLITTMDGIEKIVDITKPTHETL